MAAYFTWIKSSSIKFKDRQSALELLLNDIDFIQTPGPVLSIMKGRGNKYKVYNDDYGLIIDEEDFDDFDVSEWDGFMSLALSDINWKSRVRGGTEINVSFEDLAKMVQLSIDLEMMPSPFANFDLVNGCTTLDIKGDTDDIVAPYHLKIVELADLVVGDERYCIVSVGTPSSDGGACYLKLYIFSGRSKLKSYEFDFSRFSLASHQGDLQSIFSNIKSPEAYLIDYNEHASVPDMERIQAIMDGWSN